MMGFIVGVVFHIAFFYFPEDDWRNVFPIHHGIFGMMIMIFGYVFKNPNLFGFGAGLAVEDIGDFPWVG
jgi:hypothetical protein